MTPLLSLASAALLLTASAQAPSAATGSDRATLDSLAHETARRISRYADRRVAIAAGYRRIGTDFPSMGEHWLHASALLSQRIDPDRPTILAYAVIDGTPTLLGAGYVITTRGSESATAPGWPVYWHEHSGLLADESGAHVGAPQSSDSATHVWVLHVWSALPNPLGRYDSDNWALPFARAGIAPPAGLDANMGRVLSLAVAEGDEYLRRVLTDAGLRTADSRAPLAPGTTVDAEVDAAIEEARLVAVAVAARVRTQGAMTATDAERLRGAWASLSQRLRSALGPAVDPFLVPPHAHHGDPPMARAVPQ